MTDLLPPKLCRKKKKTSGISQLVKAGCLESLASLEQAGVFFKRKCSTIQIRYTPKA